MQNNLGLQEQLLSLAAAIGLSSQLDNVEHLDIDFNSNLLKLLQGEIDSIEIESQGLVILKDLRVQRLKIDVDRIDIDPLSVIFGQAELNQPTDIIIRLLITETDINKAARSELIYSQIPPIEVDVNGQQVELQPRDLQVQLLDGNQMAIAGKLLIPESHKLYIIPFNSLMQIHSTTPYIFLKEFHCEKDGISLALATALLNKANELISKLPYFNLAGNQLHFKNIQINRGYLKAEVGIHVEQLF